MTVAELDRWALQRGWGAPRLTQMEQSLRNFVVHPFDRNLCRKWGEVCNSAAKNGRPIQCGDAWIAATALLHDIPLVTNNASDYQGVTGLNVITSK